MEPKSLPVRSMSNCSQIKNSFERKKSNSSLTIERAKINSFKTCENEIERFQKQFIEPLSNQVGSMRFQQSKEGSIISDKSCDSGTYSRNTTPEPVNESKLRLQDKVKPLKSPPLVMSVVGEQEKTLTDQDEVSGSPVLARLPLLHQASSSGSQRGAITKVANTSSEPSTEQYGKGTLTVNEKMPHMGISRLITAYSGILKTSPEGNRTSTNFNRSDI